jgi:NitT/TauT family transport system ATP-binding protein
VDHVYKALTLPDQIPAMADIAAATKFQMLPHARPGGVSGLLEILADATGREDIYKLADELAFDDGDGGVCGDGESPGVAIALQAG